MAYLKWQAQSMLVFINDELDCSCKRVLQPSLIFVIKTRFARSSDRWKREVGWGASASIDCQVSKWPNILTGYTSHAGHKFLMELIQKLLIVDQQFRPHLIHLLQNLISYFIWNHILWNNFLNPMNICRKAETRDSLLKR